MLFVDAAELGVVLVEAVEDGPAVGQAVGLGLKLFGLHLADAQFALQAAQLLLDADLLVADVGIVGASEGDEQGDDNKPADERACFREQGTCCSSELRHEKVSEC